MCTLNVKKEKNHNGYIKKKYYAKLCDKEAIYILAYFNGFNWNWLSKQPISLDDTFWGKVQFLKNNKVKLFARSNMTDISNDELGNEAKKFFLRLYIQYVKHNGSAPSSFVFDILEIKNYNNRQFNQKESLYMQDEIKVFRFHSDGSPITQKEF